MRLRLRAITCNPSATWVTPRTTANTWSAVPNHRKTTSAKSIASRSSMSIPKTMAATVSRARLSRAMVANTITAAIPYGVTMIGKANGLNADSNPAGFSVSFG